MKFLDTLLLFLLLSLSTQGLADDKKNEALKRMQLYGEKLKTALVSGLKSGPIQAIDVCSKMAPLIAKEVSDNKIKVGRVSHKPRNFSNTIKKWMEPSIKTYLSGEKTQPFVTIKIDNHTTGHIKPIMTDGVCLTCHGQSITPEVATAIQKLYPKDSATGFSLGEIRGFIFAEVSSK
jgi:hypothetical protein